MLKRNVWSNTLHFCDQTHRAPVTKDVIPAWGHFEWRARAPKDVVGVKPSKTWGHFCFLFNSNLPAQTSLCPDKVKIHVILVQSLSSFPSVFRRFLEHSEYFINAHLFWLESVFNPHFQIWQLAHEWTQWNLIYSTPCVTSASPNKSYKWS